MFFVLLKFALLNVESTREKDWDNIAAVHRNTKVVTTWSYDKCRMGEHKLAHDRFKGVKNVEALVSIFCFFLFSNNVFR